MRRREMNVLSPISDYMTCNLSGINLEYVFSKPALLFLSFYEVLGVCIRVLDLIYRTPRGSSVERSPLFSYFNGYVIPFCNFAE